MTAGLGDVIICQHAVIHVIIAGIEIWHTPTDFATVISDLVSQTLNIPTRRTSSILQESANMRWKEAGDLLTVVIPSVLVNAVDPCR